MFSISTLFTEIAIIFEVDSINNISLRMDRWIDGQITRDINIKQRQKKYMELMYVCILYTEANIVTNLRDNHVTLPIILHVYYIIQKLRWSILVIFIVINFIFILYHISTIITLYISHHTYHIDDLNQNFLVEQLESRVPIL